MKKAKSNFLNFYNFILVGFLSALGFASSCSKPDPVAEYGVPSAKFTVNGTIEDRETNTPIKNIKVSIYQQTVATDDQGKYQITENGFGGDMTFNIQYRDEDGAANGEYNDLDTTVEFKNPQFEGGDGHWYEGETSKEFDIKLTPKK